MPGIINSERLIFFPNNKEATRLKSHVFCLAMIDPLQTCNFKKKKYINYH